MLPTPGVVPPLSPDESVISQEVPFQVYQVPVVGSVAVSPTVVPGPKVK